MRAGAEHEVGAGVDRHAREAAAVAAVLAERALRAVGHVRLVGALGAGVEEGDDDVGPARGALDQRAHLGLVAHLVAPRVGREAGEGDLRALLGDGHDLARRAGGADLGALERVTRAAPAQRAVVPGVVVGVVDDVHAGPAQRPCVARGRLEGEAVVAGRPALGRAARAEGALVVDRRDVGLAQRGADRAQQRAPRVGRVAVGGTEGDVAAPGDEQAFAVLLLRGRRGLRLLRDGLGGRERGRGEERHGDGGSGRPNEAHRREIRGDTVRIAPGNPRSDFPSDRSSRRSRLARIAYQAWSVPQCGQSTDVVTAALKM